MHIRTIHTKLLSLLVASFFLLAGTGITIVDYCCDACENAGVEFIATHSCHDMHLNNAAAEKPCCHIASNVQANTAHCTMDKTCDVERLVLDEYAPSHPVNLASPSTVIVFLSSAVGGLIENQTFAVSPFHVKYPPPEPSSCFGRSLLIQKSVLII